jgi:hypothetical protein
VGESVLKVTGVIRFWWFKIALMTLNYLNEETGNYLVGAGQYDRGIGELKKNSLQ